MANYTVPFNLSFFMSTFSCEHLGSSVCSVGLFRNDHPLLHPLPLLLLQLGSAILVSATFQRILKPLRQPRFVSDMLTGILLGPTLFQHFGDGSFYASLYAGKQTILADVLELLSFSYLAFLVGVRTDMNVIRTSGKLAWVIGITAFALPVAMSVLTAHSLGKSYADMVISLNAISILEATTSFQVTSILLEDLKLLNSEIGRLALSCSLISNLFGWIFKVGSALVSKAMVLQTQAMEAVKSEMARLALIAFILFVLRPVMFWFMKKIPEGRSIKESHLIVMSVMLFGVGFAAEALGAQAYFGAMFLGFAVPAGPPLGSGLADKLNLFVFTLLVPSYIVDAGRHVNVRVISSRSFGPVELIIVVAYVGKLVASVVPSLLFRMPYADSFSLGLILTSQGFFDILLFKRALRFGLFTEELYSILTITAVSYAAIATPLIGYLYDPSKRYVNYRRRTIQHNRPGTELRILVCLHEEESVFSMLNLLKACYPTRESPLGVYVLDLVELAGREHPLLINHQFHKRRRSSNITRTDRVIAAFRHHELRHEGTVKNQYFTTITPYASMHDDICKLALEKSASLLIIPYQKSESSAVREVKKNVLDKAPCSVGIVVDKKIVTQFQSDSLKEAKFHVCVIFSGGPDSREALAFGVRMVENHPATNLTVVRLIAEDEFATDLVEVKHDLNAISDLRRLSGDNDCIEYNEVMVKDGAETSRVLLSLDENFDFILVGRRFDKESQVVSGLSEWNSYVEELGILGDILASKDMKSNASVLVLQQQSTVEDLMPKLRF